MRIKTIILFFVAMGLSSSAALTIAEPITETFEIADVILLLELRCIKESDRHGSPEESMWSEVEVRLTFDVKRVLKGQFEDSQLIHTYSYIRIISSDPSAMENPFESIEESPEDRYYSLTGVTIRTTIPQNLPTEQPAFAQGGYFLGFVEPYQDGFRISEGPNGILCINRLTYK